MHSADQYDFFLTGVDAAPGSGPQRPAPSRSPRPTSGAALANVGTHAPPATTEGGLPLAPAPLEPLREFLVPPAPRLSRRNDFYTLSQTEQLQRRPLTQWERQNILAQLEKPEPVDEEAFQQRLCTTRQRNEDSARAEVSQRAAEAEKALATQREEVFATEEHRRNDVFFRHQNIVQLRQMEKFVKRATSWYNIVVAHVFITALIQERQVQEALETFGLLMAPMVKRFLTLRRQRAERVALLQAHLRDIPFPTPEVIGKMYGTFFQGWPPYLLEQLAAKAKPMFLRQGSPLMHAGDVGRVMYMITTGRICIILPKRGKDKRRVKDNSSGAFDISAPCYVGEFALVCKEPRSATIVCETDIGYWAVSPEDYEAVAQHLSPDVASKQREATDVRRRQNLKRFFPLTVEFLRKFPYFEKFSDASLAIIADKVEPIVLHDGDYLFQTGKIDTNAYFVQDGVARLRDEYGEESAVATGSCVGVFECSCGVNEPKRSSIVSVNYCDIWRLSRDVLIDVGMSEPGALLHCRGAAKTQRAVEMKKSPKVPALIREDPFLNFCLLPVHLNRFYELCTPSVFLNGERLVLMGQPFTSFVVLLSGTADVTTAVNGEQVTSRITSLPPPVVSAPAHTVSTQDDHADTTHNTTGRNSAIPAVPHTAHVAAPVASAPPPLLSYVFGAYEFASSSSQYSCTVTSFGLCEAYVVNRHKFETLLPPELKNVLLRNTKARDLVVRANKKKDTGMLRQPPASGVVSFAQAYKALKETTAHKDT